MKLVVHTLLASILAAATTAAAVAQSTPRPAPPASAPLPMTAASKQVPTRNAAIMAAENAKEPGNQRPEERVIPQIRIPLTGTSSTGTAATTPAPSAGNVPGGVDDGTARCMAANSAADKAACERRLAASAPMKSQR